MSYPEFIRRPLLFVSNGIWAAIERERTVLGIAISVAHFRRYAIYYKSLPPIIKFRRRTGRRRLVTASSRGRGFRLD